MLCALKMNLRVGRSEQGLPVNPCVSRAVSSTPHLTPGSGTRERFVSPYSYSALKSVPSSCPNWLFLFVNSQTSLGLHSCLFLDALVIPPGLPHHHKLLFTSGVPWGNTEATSIFFFYFGATPIMLRADFCAQGWPLVGSRDQTLGKSCAK